MIGFILITLLYILFIVFVCIRILLSTQYANKALAYIMFAIFLPVVGVGFYFLFGVNYWKKRLSHQIL